MKYRVLVEKHNDAYVACCPELPHLRVAGKSVNAVLERLHREFLMFVHDADAELEIVTPKQRTDVSQQPQLPPLA